MDELTRVDYQTLGRVKDLDDRFFPAKPQRLVPAGHPHVEVVLLSLVHPIFYDEDPIPEDLGNADLRSERKKIGCHDPWSNSFSRSGSEGRVVCLVWGATVGGHPDLSLCRRREDRGSRAVTNCRSQRKVLRVSSIGTDYCDYCDQSQESYSRSRHFFRDLLSLS